VKERWGWGYARTSASVEPDVEPPSGLYWRCLVTPASNTLASHGAQVAEFDDALVAFYTSGQGAKLLNQLSEGTFGDSAGACSKLGGAGGATPVSRAGGETTC